MIGAEDQAALPAGSPPAIDEAGREHPVAERGAHVAAVGADVLAIVSVGDHRRLQARGKTHARELQRAGELALLARHVAEAPQGHRISRSRHAAFGAPLARTRRRGGRGAQPCQRGGHVGRQRRAIAGGSEVAGYLAPGDRPLGERRTHDAGIGQQLQVVAQAGVARGGPGIGGGGDGGRGERNQAGGNQRETASCGQPASPAVAALGDRRSALPVHCRMPA